MNEGPYRGVQETDLDSLRRENNQLTQRLDEIKQILDKAEDSKVKDDVWQGLCGALVVIFVCLLGYVLGGL